MPSHPTSSCLRQRYLFPPRAQPAFLLGLLLLTLLVVPGAGAQALQTSSPLLPAVSRSDGLVNLARNRAALASSAVDDTHTAQLATDGSAASYWASRAGGEQWITVDFGKISTLQRVTLRWGDSFAQKYRLEVSDEDTRPTRWTAIYSTEQGRGGIEELTFPSTRARHLRLVGTAPASNQGFALAEIEAWGGPPTAALPPPPLQTVENGALLTAGWQVQNASFVTAAPAAIAAAGFDTTGWLPAQVPGTVLASYLADGAVPDPYYSDQVTQISDGFFTANDFWYRTAFVIPTADNGRKLWLNFDGINWKAEVFLNGVALGRIDGAFIRGRFDITAAAKPGGTNQLAVLVHQVAHPGVPTHKRIGGNYRNGGILGTDSPTFVSSMGWNWVPAIPGRNIGIWNNVRFETGGEAALVDPWVTAAVSANLQHADLTVRTGLSNLSDQPKRVVVLGSFSGVAFQHEIALPPHQTTQVTLDKSVCPELALDHPRLWWPNGYGDANLYGLKLRVEDAGATSDTKEVSFGIRSMDYRVENNNVLTFYVNGVRILVRGGNWGMDDAMLNVDAAGYDLRVRLHHDLNLNMIRNWVGMVGSEEFYNACDRYGILVWDDFWLANPSDGPEPADHAMFLANVRDKVLRVRSHPSEALYCGRNEGNPPADLDAGMRDAVTTLDGTRHYIPHSAAGTVTGGGPYEVRDPVWYFTNRGSTMHSELGIVCVPTVESMRAMLPADRLWPINDLWAIHDYQTPRSVSYSARIDSRYGVATGLEDYCRKAQLLNLETGKAMMESLQSRQGGGTLIWMTQSAWPALICQLYDYYFDETGAYFGVKTGAEPLHILWDQRTNLIRVANDTGTARPDLHAEAWIYDLDGRERWHQSANLNLPATSVADCFPLVVPTDISAVYFVKLSLAAGAATVSRNFYWSPARGADCTALNNLPKVSLPFTATLGGAGDERRITATVTNSTASVALAVRLKLVRDHSGERVLPALYEDNYFSLLPGESRTVGITFASSALAGESPRLVEEGWNITPADLPVR